MARKGKMKHRMHTNPFNYRHALPLIDQKELFGREAPLALDVGCGPGAFTADLARKHPEWNCIGNEIRRHYVELTEEKREQGNLTNLRGLFANANLQLPAMLPDDSIVFFSHNFPDPWFKKRHEKRRVLNLKFLYDMRPKFKDGCELHVMTDYQPIGDSMRKALMNCSFLKPLRGNHDFIEESTTGIFSERELVHQEKRGEKIWRMAYVYDASLPVVEPPPELMGTKKSGEAGATGEGGEESESEDSDEEMSGEAGPSTSNGKRSREGADNENASSSKKVQLTDGSSAAASSSTGVDSIELTAPADFHVHLRQGEMSELIAPHVAQGGISLAYVMPNLVPPITTVDAAVAYHSTLKEIAPDTDFWMTLYLHPSLTPEEIEKAAQGGVVKGVKSYPRGVTTNSEGGIESYEAYYPVFEAMEKHGLVLNLHGEVPSDAEKVSQDGEMTRESGGAVSIDNCSTPPLEHHRPQRRGHLPLPLAQDPRSLPVPPHRPRARHHPRSRRGGENLWLNSGMQHHSSSPRTHCGRLGRQAIALLQARGQMAGRPQSTARGD